MKPKKRKADDDEDEDEVDEGDVGPDPEPVTVKFSRAEAKKWFNVKSRIATRDYGSLESSELHKARIYAGCVAYGRKKPESATMAENRAFLLEKLQLDVEPDDPPPPPPPRRRRRRRRRRRPHFLALVVCVHPARRRV